MKQSKLWIFLIAVVVIVMGGLVTVVLLLNQPINEPISLQKDKPTSTSLVLATEPSTSETAETEKPAVILPSSTPPAITSICGGNGSMLVLILGRDEERWRYPYGVDLIRLIKVNFDQKTIAMYALPRDLLMKTPHLAEYQLTQSNLGPAYYYIRDIEGNDHSADVAATSAIAQIIYDNFGIEADHYMTVEESVLTDAIDTVGGINVVVPAAVNNDEPDLILHLEPGPQTMDGATAQKYVRYLVTDNSLSDEWGRFDRQAIIIKSLVEKLVTPAVFPKVPELFSEFKQKVITDLTPAQILQMACLAKTIPYDQIKADSITRDQVTIVGDSMVLNDPEAISKIMEELFK